MICRFQLGATSRSLRPAARLDSLVGGVAAGYTSPSTGDILGVRTGVNVKDILLFII